MSFLNKGAQSVGAAGLASGTTAALAGGSGALAGATSYLSSMSTAASGSLMTMASPVLMMVFLFFLIFLLNEN